MHTDLVAKKIDGDRRNNLAGCERNMRVYDGCSHCQNPLAFACACASLTDTSAASHPSSGCSGGLKCRTAIRPSNQTPITTARKMELSKS